MRPGNSAASDVVSLLVWGVRWSSFSGGIHSWPSDLGFVSHYRDPPCRRLGLVRPQVLVPLVHLPRAGKWAACSAELRTGFGPSSWSSPPTYPLVARFTDVFLSFICDATSLQQIGFAIYYWTTEAWYVGIFFAVVVVSFVSLVAFIRPNPRPGHASRNLSHARDSTIETLGWPGLRCHSTLIGAGDRLHRIHFQLAVPDLGGRFLRFGGFPPYFRDPADPLHLCHPPLGRSDITGGNSVWCHLDCLFRPDDRPFCERRGRGWNRFLLRLPAPGRFI